MSLNLSTLIDILRNFHRLNPARHTIWAEKKRAWILPFYFRNVYYYRKLLGINFEDFDRDDRRYA